MRPSSLALSVLLLVPAGAASAQDLCGVNAPDLAGLRAQVASLPGAKPVDSRSPDFDVISVGQGQIWNFTKPQHPAHPAVACRTIREKDGQLYVETRLRCQASKERCDGLAGDYARLDRQMTDAMKPRPPAK